MRYLAVLTCWAHLCPAAARAEQPTYVGKWAERPQNCQSEPDYTYNAQSMSGNESACRFSHIGGGAGTWQMTWICKGEGGPRTEQVELQVLKNTMQVKDSSGTSKLTRCD